MHWIPPQVVVIVEIFVAERQSVNALTNKLLNTMFDIALVTVVDETVGKISHQTAVAFKFAKYQPSAVTGELATSEIYFHFSVT